MRRCFCLATAGPPPALSGIGAAVAVWIVGAIASVAAPRSARADVIDDAWNRGNQAYLRGDDATAIAAYEQLDRQGVVSPDLAYNLGNAYFRRGQLGPAVWAFERALALDPAHEDARYNLDRVRKIAARAGASSDAARLASRGDDQEPLWIRAVTAVAPSTVGWTFLATWFALFVLLAALIVTRRRRRRAATTAPVAEAAAPAAAAGRSARAHGEDAGLLAAGVALAVVGVLTTGALLVGRLALDRVPFAVVLPETVAVREGADKNYRTGFSVHAGLKVRLLDQDHGWVRIRLPNGLDGWIPESAARRI